MRKTSRVLIVFTMLMLVMSLSVFAAYDPKEKVADFDFGKKQAGGKNWGFVYMLEHDDEGKFPEEGILHAFFHVNDKDGPRNRTVPGAYIEDGQEVNTIIGLRLGVDYSPYVAKFHGNSRLLGVRVGKFVYDFGPVSLGIDGAYILSSVEVKKDAKAWKYSLAPRKNDILLGVDLDVDVLEGLAIDLAMNRYSVEKPAGEEGLYDYYYNVSAEAAMEIIPGLNVTGLYAFYSEASQKSDGEDIDFLYEVTADYEVLPDQLWVRAGHRNSEFTEVDGKTYDKSAVLGGYGGGNEWHYIADKKPIENIYKRDSSFNVGATYNFVYDILSATAKADFDTTNPNKRGDFDDKLTLSLDATALDFKLNQAFSVMFPDDESDREIKTHADPTSNRYDYELDFYTPTYRLPVDFVDVFAQAKVNFDWDNNYLAESRSHAIGSVELGAYADVWRLPNMYFGAILAYDMPSDKDMIEDAFKFALLSTYDAPNGIGFRLEYQNSPDYADSSTWVHEKALNDRYDDIRHYGNSKFDGIRLTIGFPL